MNPVSKNAASRRRYAERRARNECTDCRAPAYGASRCPECAKRSYEHSDWFRGMPLYPPSFAVVEIETGECRGVFDDEADVALCLAFARLSRDQVEVIADEPLVSRYAAWE